MANPNPSPAHRFKPGNNGNPNGRPPGKGIGTALREKLAEADEEGRTPADRIADAMIALAVAGDVRAASFVADRTTGKPRQSVTFENSRPGVVTVKYVNDWRRKPMPGDPPPGPPK